MQSLILAGILLYVAGCSGFEKPTPLKVDCQSQENNEDFRHRLKHREHAEDKTTIWLFKNEELNIVFEFDKRTDIDILNVQYSNDGKSDTMSLLLDGKKLGSFKTDDRSHWGFMWDRFYGSGPIGGRQSLEAGTHTLALKVDEADKYGVEIDYIRVDVHGSLKGRHPKDHFMCFHKPSTTEDVPMAATWFKHLI